MSFPAKIWPVAYNLVQFVFNYGKLQKRILKSAFQHDIKIQRNTFLTSIALGFLWPVKKINKESNANVPAQKQPSILELSDSLFENARYEECLKLLSESEDIGNVEIQWRICRALYNMSKDMKYEKSIQNNLIVQAYDLISKQVEGNQDHYAVHKWYALLLDAKSSLGGIKERIKQLENVKKHMDLAVTLNPHDATTLHMLGEWCFQITELPWHQRKIAEVLFAAPPQSSYEDALEYFLRAESVQPRFYSINLLRLGYCYLKLQKDDQAKYYLKLAASYPAKSNDDHHANKEATELLKSLSFSAVNSPTNKNDPNTSLKLIESQSQPNLISSREVYTVESPGPNSPYWFEKTSDDSFDMAERLCVSPRNPVKTEELNNTLEVIEYILNNPPIGSGNVKSEIMKNEKSPEKPVYKAENDKIVTSKKDTPKIVDNVERKKEKVNAFKKADMKPRITPLKHTESYATPTHTKYKPIFKTPAQPLSQKKPSATSLKKTPCKTNAYQHISSPVASYIKNCPTVPLVKDVHPKMPLPGSSSIPKFVKCSIPTKEKENIILPSVAYKSAKKTRVIDIPDENKLPQSQWVKKMISALPKPMVMKHNHREMNVAKKILTQQQEDSFANLSYHQAELSVCTQKSAFKPNNV